MYEIIYIDYDEFLYILLSYILTLKVIFVVREADRDKFKELAEKRVTRALKDIKLIGNLSNKSNYSYTDQDVKKIYSALKKSLDEMKSRFDSSGMSEEEIFKL